MTAQRTSKSADWGTPDFILEAVHKTLGGIDLDPCSSPEHQLRVKAATACYSDGLSVPWDSFRNVYVNPPGSGRGVQGWWSVFWRGIASGVWLGFNMNQLAYLTPSPFDVMSWVLIPRKRLHFVGAGNNPPHNSFLCGLHCSADYLQTALYTHQGDPGTLVINE